MLRQSLLIFLLSLYVRGKLVVLPVSVGNNVYEFYNMDVKAAIKLYDGEVTHICHVSKLCEYRIDENGIVYDVEGW